MNIERLNAGIVRPPAALPPTSARVDLTISDRGVTSVRPQAGLETDRSPLIQVTSNRALQQVLSAEETQALQKAFSTSFHVAPKTAPPATGYELQATRMRARTAPVLGGLVDFSG